MEDYYSILQINRNATPAEIKSSYRKLALLYHPDKNRGGTEKFKTICQAYATLIDPEKRRSYDSVGVDFCPFTSESFNFQTFFKFDDKPVPKCPPIIITLFLNLEEVYNGTTKYEKVKRKVACRSCYGAQNCAACLGTGCVLEDHIFTIDVKKGVLENQERHFIGEGNEDPNNLPGDVIFVYAFNRNEFYKPGIYLRLDAEVQISKEEAEKGFTRFVRSLDGQTLLKIDHYPNYSDFKRIYNGSVRYIVNEGMPDYSEPHLKGNFYITFKVVEDPKSNNFVQATEQLDWSHYRVKPVQLVFLEDPKIKFSLFSLFKYFKSFFSLFGVAFGLFVLNTYTFERIVPSCQSLNSTEAYTFIITALCPLENMG